MHLQLREVNPIPSRLTECVETGELGSTRTVLVVRPEPLQRRWSWTAATGKREVNLAGLSRTKLNIKALYR